MLGTYQNASAITGVLQLAIDSLDLEVATLLRHGEQVISLHAQSRAGAATRPAEHLQTTEAASSPLLGPCLVVRAGGLLSRRESSLRLERAAGSPFTEQDRATAAVLASAVVYTEGGLALLTQEGGWARAGSDDLESGRLRRKLRDRDALIDQLSGIQHALSQRAPRQDILDMIVDAAAELIGDETVNLRMVDPADPTLLLRVAGRGYSEEVEPFMARIRTDEGAVGRAFTEGRLVVIEDYQSDKDRLGILRSEGLEAAMSAPVEENGRVIGALTVATHRRGRTYSLTEQQMLITFAVHASVALTNARIADTMAHLAFHDTLTGLPNRALFVDRVTQALARSGRTAHTTAVLFADLDNFKAINDRFGHQAGDCLLITVADRLQTLVRAGDTVSRLGGDEFVVLADDLDDPEATARSLAERIHLAMRVPVTVGDRQLHTSVSIGIAPIGPDSDPEICLAQADAAMYQA